MATIPSDPLFSSQWHLQNNTTGLYDLNVVDVWDDYTGAGVEVAIIDDAVQRNHPDLDANYSVAKDWDFANNDTNPTGVNGQNHGTAVAGIIGANANNGIGGVGVAYDSTIFGFGISSFQTVVDAINNASGLRETVGRNREADVVNMSLGTSGFLFFYDQEDITVFSDLNTAIDNAVAFGRDGLGTILVKSAGNSRSNNQDTNASSWNANPHTISVAAVNQNGFVSSYSTHGASVLVSGFGTPGQVVTTDRTGFSGYSSSNYTFGFNGTSAAAPMVSGVVALMLEANPDLGWRDVQDILAYSARHVGTNVGFGTGGAEEYAWSFNGADNWNGGGLHFSNDYGFGLVDAKAAVRLAETWNDVPQTSANDATVFRDFLNATRTISTGGTSFSQYIGSNIDIEHVEVDINFTQWHDLGDLELRLTSPDGTTSILIDNSGENSGSASGGFGSGRWEFFSHQFRGESTVGTWSVQLFDRDSTIVSPITINDIDITFTGKAASNDDTFIVTEEFSDYAGLYGHSTAFNGGIGTDTINTAAIASSSVIDLQNGTGTIDGVAITTSSIETVIGGDGHDVITGNSSANRLLGMRGNDTISGRGGDDYMDGGAGWDTVDYEYLNSGGTFNLSTGVASLNGFYNEDILNFEAIVTGGGVDIVTGTSGYNRIETGAGNDVIHAGGGADDLIGGTGADMMHGGGGSDRYFVDNAGDSVIEGIGAGTDIVYSYLSNYVLTHNVENLYLAGAGAYDGVGNALDNIIYGNSNDNDLYGQDGDDTIYSYAGDDYIDGSAGDDDMYGGTGNDTYVVDSAADSVTEFANQGTDRVISTIASYTLGANLENLQLSQPTAIDGYGNALNNQILGNIGLNVDNDLRGFGGNDGLYGYGGDDDLWGGAGTDYLHGGTGDDDMYGGTGGDTYVVDSTGDVVTEFAGEGFDRVYSSIDYTLGSNVEMLRLIGTAYRGYGNTLDNRVVGNDSNNYLWGGSAGDDDLYGQAGDDILVGGIGDDYLNGGEDNDTLIGNTGEDFLAAGNGNDLLIGGQDDDVLWGGNDADRFRFTSTAASHGIDSIMDFVSADGDRIEILASGFGGGLVAGVLGVSQFVIGAAAVDASDRLIYNSASGALSFDVDGSGSAASVQFATLSGTPSLTNSDIFVV